MRIEKLTTSLTAITLGLLVTACASSSPVGKPTAVDVMKNGGTYEYTKPTGPIYANSSAELAERFVGRHVDELPEATAETKAVQDPNEVVCKVVKQTKTRLRKKKICAPKKEWDMYKAEASRTMKQKQITRRAGD